MILNSSCCKKISIFMICKKMKSWRNNQDLLKIDFTIWFKIINNKIAKFESDTRKERHLLYMKKHEEMS
jgi:hypothetical protein